MKTKHKPLSSFCGVLSKESGERFEKNIKDRRKRTNKEHQNKILITSQHTHIKKELKLK